jgi:hypothetical protein
MKKAKYYKILFLVAGLWNLVAAILCWLGLVIMPGMVSGLFGMPQPASLFPFHAMFSFIVVFGIGYFIVSHDITRNQGLVVIGSLGKLLFFIDCLISLVLNEGNLLLLLTGSIDLAFALLFIEFLLTDRKNRHLTSVKQL